MRPLNWALKNRLGGTPLIALGVRAEPPHYGASPPSLVCCVGTGRVFTAQESPHKVLGRPLEYMGARFTGCLASGLVYKYFLKKL